MKIYEIIPNKLYISAMPRTDKARDQVVDLGFTRVVSLSSRVPTWSRRHKSYILSDHRPLSDGTKVNEPNVNNIANLVNLHITSGEKVLVHCVGGRNRAGLIAALVLCQREGISGREARRRVLKSRPNALYNPAFISFLNGIKKREDLG